MNKLFIFLFLLMCMLTINSSSMKSRLLSNMKDNELKNKNRVLTSDLTDQNLTICAAASPAVLDMTCIANNNMGCCIAWKSILPENCVSICILNLVDPICVKGLQAVGNGV